MYKFTSISAHWKKYSVVQKYLFGGLKVVFMWTIFLLNNVMPWFLLWTQYLSFILKTSKLQVDVSL